MSLNSKASGFGIAAVLSAIAPAAHADITFDPATRPGFVGKGDVQTALGLNNAQVQAIASSLAFTYVATSTYEVREAWATGNADHPVSLNSPEITLTTTYDVNRAVAYQPRQVNGYKQVTGFYLTGFMNLAAGGVVPDVDQVYWVTYTWTDKKGVQHTTDQMPVDQYGNLYTEGNNKAIRSVELLSSSGGLYVNGIVLPWTP